MRLRLLLASVVTTVAALVGTAATAGAVNTATTCVQGPVYWPTTGQVVSSNGSQRSATLNFQMTQAQLNALACSGGYARVAFVTQNSGVPASQAFTLSTNISSPIKDVAAPTASTFAPGAAFAVSSLNANQPYNLTVSWTGGNSNATFTSDWIGAHWASQLNAFERNRCNNGQSQGGWSWCVYQTGASRHSLTGGNVALGGTYPVQ